MDMYDYVLQFPQPALVTPPAKPQAPKAPVPLTRAQARDKARKEKQELRDWWDDLPEEKRQEVRDMKYWVTKPKEKKPKPEAKKPAKPAKPAEPEAQKPPAKPSWENYQGPQQWARVEM